jgi:hypothetical protein
MLDPCLVLGLVRLAHTSLLDVLRRGFSGWAMFWVKNHGPYLAREYLCVKNYGPYPPVVLIESGRVEFFWAGWVGRLMHRSRWKAMMEAIEMCKMVFLTRQKR